MVTKDTDICNFAFKFLGCVLLPRGSEKPVFFFVEAFLHFVLSRAFLRTLAVLRELRQVLSYNQKSLTEQRKPCIYHASIGHLRFQSHYGDLLSNLGFLQASLFWKLASKWKAKAFPGNADSPVKPITLLKPTLLKRGV